MPIGKQNEHNRTNVVEFMEDLGSNFRVGTVGLQTVENPPRAVRERYLRREDTGTLLSEVGPSYTILQNETAFSHLQPFIDSGTMKMVSGGIGMGGKACWISCKVLGHDGEVALGDSLENYFTIMNPFDGMKAVYTLFSPKRLACDNQLRGMASNKASKMIRIKHHSQVETNLSRVMTIVDTATADFRANLEQYQFLARRSVNQADLQKYVLRLWELTPETVKDASTRTKNILEGVFNFVESGVGQNVPSTRGSYYWMYNGVNGWLNHVDCRNADNRFNSLMWGTNADFDQRAFNLALDMANAA